MAYAFIFGHVTQTVFTVALGIVMAGVVAYDRWSKRR